MTKIEPWSSRARLSQRAGLRVLHVHPGIEQANGLGVNSYLSKPNHLEEVQELVELLGQYWLNKNGMAGPRLSKCVP